MSVRTHIVSWLVLALAASGFAQGKPDFSGEWTLNRQASTVSPAAAAIQSGDVRIEHRDPAFRYKAALKSEAGSVQYEFELQSDGREVTSTQQGMATATSLRWDGEALVLSSRIERSSGEMKIVFRYELLDSGRRLRAVEQIRGAGRDQDNIWIFERRDTRN
jgi:hypothetical protein